MPVSISARLEKIITALIKGTIFLLPLFFLPWTAEFFEFNKQFLLWLVAPLALFLWLIKQAASGEIKIKINPLNLPILIFLALTGVSSWFSLDRFSSFFGYFGRFSDAWLGLLSLVIFYFLLINTGVADSSKKIFDLLKLFLYSSVAVAIISVCAMFGLLGAVFADPLNVLASASFNPAGGSVLSLGIFLAIISVILVSFLFSGNLKKFDRIFFGACLVLLLIILALINFSLSWIILLSGAGLIIFFHWLKAGFNFRKILNYYLLPPAVIMLIAVFFLALPKINPVKFPIASRTGGAGFNGVNLAKVILDRQLPKEAILEYSKAFTITKEVLKKNPVLGSGPGTYAQDFSLYRPAELNGSAYWQIRFDKSASHFLEILATAGIPVWLSYFLIISLVIYINIILFIKYLKNREPFLENEDYNLIITIFTVFILLFFSQLAWLTNTVLNFTFWFFLGLLIAFWQLNNHSLFKERIINLNKSLIFFRLFLLVLFLLSVGWIMLAAFEIKFFAAELIAAQGASREKSLMTAVKLNPYRYNYDISLAKFYLSRARVEALQPPPKRDNGYIQLNITQAVATAKQAAAQAPNSVLAQETLGMIYRDIRPLTIGSEPWAVRSFTRAFELEPTNPVLATELAKAYLNNNDTANAEKYFIKAAELKPDYYEAKFGLAKVYLKNKKDNLAFNLLNELAVQVYDPEIFYELGRFYYNHGEIDKAIDRFKLVLSILPKHPNSLYSLGIAYEAKGDIKQALKYYEKVLELNPENKDVLNKIKLLKE